MSDPVQSPAHYCINGYECLDVIRAIVEASGMPPYEAFLYGSAMQYVWRYKMKNGVQDIDKAIRYLGWIREELERQEEGGTI